MVLFLFNTEENAFPSVWYAWKLCLIQQWNLVFSSVTLSQNHSDKKDLNKSYFQRLGENVKIQRLDQTGQSYQKSTGILYASNEVSLLIAKNMKAHTIAENLVLPAARILVCNLIGEKGGWQIEFCIAF